ncbi:hypothetical protein HYS72_00625 [Candidatus Pacearchaeota archaeon]|nr:hypothetical protein [Candidatus Pacearchaeota archaeon]MBI2057310.1 hypothetical protein [Candidatus Pacearchaeota archaeon]
MKTLNYLVAGMIGLGLNGCNLDYTKKEQSGVMNEKGLVVTTLYNKRHSSTDIAPGITTGGDIAISVSSTTIPETWGVVFRCEHKNKFPIMGSEESYKELWNKLDEGDSVTILYKEVYKVKYDGKTDEVISKELFDYDFIGAEKINTLKGTR